jgi:hypothetical protein
MSEKTGLELLREPFPANLISQLPKPTCNAQDWRKLPKGECKVCGGYHATSKTIHLAYVGHAALTDRLLDCDPEWNWEPCAVDEFGLPKFDESGGLWIRLTVCGVTRLGYGHAKENSYAEIGSRIKEVIGDALRNAAMRSGAALDLWHKGDLHLPEDEKNIVDDGELYSKYVDHIDKLNSADEVVSYVTSIWDEVKKNLSEQDKKKLKSYANQVVDVFNSEK